MFTLKRDGAKWGSYSVEERWPRFIPWRDAATGGILGWFIFRFTTRCHQDTIPTWPKDHLSGQQLRFSDSICPGHGGEWAEEEPQSGGAWGHGHGYPEGFSSRGRLFQPLQGEQGWGITRKMVITEVQAKHLHWMGKAQPWGETLVGNYFRSQ